MAKNNAANQDFTENADGWDLAGGATNRKLTVSGGDVAVVGGGSATITFPTSTSTLATLALAETLTNKTIAKASNTTTGFHFTVEFTCISSAPADATTYYFGFPFDTSMLNTTPARRQKIIPVACTLRAAAISVLTAGGATTEASTFTARINDTTDVTLSSAITMDQIFQAFTVTGLSTAVAATDKIEIKVLTPTWTTNPTSVRASVTLFFD